MGTHPNTILMAVLTPANTSRKTMREILEVNVHAYEEEDEIKINGTEYRPIVMESSYHEGYQIAAQEGDLVFFDHIGYGYGEVIKWDDLEKRKNDLDAWARETAEKHNCTYYIAVTANYW